MYNQLWVTPETMQLCGLIISVQTLSKDNPLISGVKYIKYM